MATLLLQVVLITKSSFSQDLNGFPLWGSSWVVMQGENQRVRYPTVSPLEPKSAILVSFVNLGNQKKVWLQWANLNQNDYAVTSEVENDIEIQFSKHKNVVDFKELNKSFGVDINYQVFNDTTWSCDEALAAAPNEFATLYREVNGEVSEFGAGFGRSTLRTSPLYTKSMPTCWGKRMLNEQDANRYPNCTDGRCYRTAGAADGGFDNYCDDPKVNTPTHSCYVALAGTKSKSANLGYWQVHLYPEVWYYCREPESGKPILDERICPKMKPEKAFAMKKASLDDPNNLNLKMYRNPYLSDSASTIISFSFIDDGSRQSPLVQRDYIWLSATKAKSVMSFEHYPNRMFRVKELNSASLEEALLLSYSETAEEEKRIRDLSWRCSSWKAVDSRNGERFFPMSLRKDGHFSADKGIDRGNYIYNDCPDYPHSDVFDLTINQMRRILWQPPPMCALTSMKNALDFYQRSAALFKVAEDVKAVNERIKEVSFLIANRTGNVKGNTENEKLCPEHWVDQYYR